MDESFRSELFTLIETILKPEKLVLKMFNGCKVNAVEFLKYAKHYLKLIQSKNFPPEITDDNSDSSDIDERTKNFVNEILEGRSEMDSGAKNGLN